MSYLLDKVNVLMLSLTKERGKFNMFTKTIFNMISILGAGTQADNAVDPLYDAITTIGPYAMGVVLLLTIIYGIILGVKYAKAEESKERAALQKALINGIIGFLSVLVLLAILFAIREPLVDWMNS